MDLAWEEAGRAGPAHPLPESHPLVRTERAVWEVRAAGRLLLASIQVNILSHEENFLSLSETVQWRSCHLKRFKIIKRQKMTFIQNYHLVLLIFYLMQDLELHQSFLKRVKVLVATFAELAAQLLDQEQLKEEQEGKIDRDGILTDAADFPPSSPPQATFEMPSVVSSTTPLFASSKTPSAGSSKKPLSAGWISFRSKRHLERTAALAESLRKDFNYSTGNKKLL